MTRRCAIIPFLGLAALLVVTGCSHTSIVGEGRRHEQVVQGTIGLMGEDNEIILLAGSDVPKLSIIGEDNRLRYRGAADDDADDDDDDDADDDDGDDDGDEDDD